MNKGILSLKRHPYHLVTSSPWPIIGAGGALALTVGTVMYMHFYKGGLLMMLLGLKLRVEKPFTFWSRDIIREGTYEGMPLMVARLEDALVLFVGRFFGAIDSILPRGMLVGSGSLGRLIVAPKLYKYPEVPLAVRDRVRVTFKELGFSDSEARRYMKGLFGHPQLAFMLRDPNAPDQILEGIRLFAVLTRREHPLCEILTKNITARGTSGDQYMSRGVTVHTEEDYGKDPLSKSLIPVPTSIDVHPKVKDAAESLGQKLGFSSYLEDALRGKASSDRELVSGVDFRVSPPVRSSGILLPGDVDTVDDLFK